MKHTLLVGVRKFSIALLNIDGGKKNSRRSAALNTGGDSKASCSRELKIFILGIGRSRERENAGPGFYTENVRLSDNKTFTKWIDIRIRAAIK